MGFARIPARNNAFVDAIKRVTERPAMAIGIFSQDDEGKLFSLILVDASSGDGRHIHVTRKEDDIPAEDVVFTVRKLKRLAESDDVPVFRQEDHSEEYCLCWRLIDPLTLQPAPVKGQPVVIPFNP